MAGFGTLKRVRVGRMRHRAWLEEKKQPETESERYDARGHAVYQWTRVHQERIPMELKQLFGREREQARTIVANATHRVTMNYVPDVTREMRFLLDDRELYIGDVENIEESNRILVVLCEEKIK